MSAANDSDTSFLATLSLQTQAEGISAPGISHPQSVHRGPVFQATVARDKDTKGSIWGSTYMQSIIGESRAGTKESQRADSRAGGEVR